MLQSILKRFPELTPEDVSLRDDADGKGVYIDKWNSDKEKPTPEEFKRWHEEDMADYTPPLTIEEQMQKQQEELAAAKASNESLNTQLIELWEILLAGGVI